MQENINTLFQKWQKYNLKSDKENRKKQRITENKIYSILYENASEDIKNMLPVKCDTMEIGFDRRNNVFFFIGEWSTNLKNTINKITIDVNKNVELKLL